MNEIPEELTPAPTEDDAVDPCLKLLQRERADFLNYKRRIDLGSAGEEFDPAVHEAVVYHEEQSAHEQHVQRVLRPGYRLGTRLLRPAQVVVAGPPRNGSATTNANDASANQGRHHDGQSTRN